MRRSALLALVALTALSACGGDDGAGGGGDGDGDGGFVDDVRSAIEAVEVELGGPQDYFEVTASEQLTNVFVAVDDASAAIPFVYLDGELQAPGPTLEGASGSTFGAEAVDFEPSEVLTRIDAEVPDAVVETFSVEGGPSGSVRYVVAVRSPRGGVLDVVVGPRGTVLSVEPA